MVDEIYRFQVGKLECLALCALAGPSTVRGDYTNVPDDELERACRALNYDPDDVPAACIPLAVRSEDGQWILVDTSVPGDATTPNPVAALLRTAGITPEAIQQVVITHVHFDHLGGLADEADQLIYPNACYVLWQTEWADWWSKKRLADTPRPVSNVDRTNHQLSLIKDKINLLEVETEIVPGVTITPLLGHTSGQVGLWLKSAGEQMLFIADAMHTPMQIAHPEWIFGFDTHPEVAIATRRAIMERAAAAQIPIMAYHFPFPGIGKVIADGNAWKWQPLVSSG